MYRKKPIFPHFFTLFSILGENENFPEKSSCNTFVPLWTRNFMQKIRKIVWANFKKIQKKWFCPTAPPNFAPFCPFLGQTGIFTKKWHHHLKRLMVFYLYAKNYKKRLKGSKDIAIWKIEWFDWSRAFAHKSREWKFSQTWSLHRKLANHKTLHFRSFLAKTKDSIFRKSPKTLFLGLFGHFSPIF